MKRVVREKVSNVLITIGAIGILGFASAIDGPGSDMQLVYAGIIASIILEFLGVMIGGYISKSF